MTEELKQRIKCTNDNVFKPISYMDNAFGLASERMLMHNVLLNQVAIMNAMTAMCNKLVEIDDQIIRVKNLVYSK